MSRGLIRWKLNEIMARHRIKGKDLANYLGVSANAVSMLKNASILPEIGGERWEQICAGINELSQINEAITPFDMIEYIPNESLQVGNKLIATSNANNKNNLPKNSTPDAVTPKSSHRKRSSAA